MKSLRREKFKLEKIQREQNFNSLCQMMEFLSLYRIVFGNAIKNVLKVKVVIYEVSKNKYLTNDVMGVT